jgi:hypothetical protein
MNIVARVVEELISLFIFGRAFPVRLRIENALKYDFDGAVLFLA